MANILIDKNGKKKYIYDYPEQRLLWKQLAHGDILRISKITGYSYSHTIAMMQGTRRMTPRVKEMAEKIIAFNEMLQLTPKNQIIMDKKDCKYWIKDSWNGNIITFNSLRAARRAVKKQYGKSVCIHNKSGQIIEIALASGYMPA